MGATGMKVSFSMLSGREFRGEREDLASARLPFETDLLEMETGVVTLVRRAFEL
jgi:hypothetical protein